eukprot:CAMPEP_0113579832 /NCGR_PEP_ID=MMETSP0015_2-20120614/30300_1 /TAXON_ID=2838 /ORGANISM="Odontella" /LENGTH=71 /DNA_ID=CAMNT_0000483881 /DNA_START=312 /DNA_END=524 /DNA_ORIENTATION=+ /assembly_acc=CAM_ASM_000160
MTPEMAEANDEYQIKLLTKRFGSQYIITKYIPKEDNDKNNANQDDEKNATTAAAAAATVTTSTPSYILKPK